MNVFLVFFLLTVSTAVVIGSVIRPENVDDLIDKLTEFEDGGGDEDEEHVVERERRSNLMAQILYDELRQKLKNEPLRSGSRSLPNRRVASASLMVRKRRATTPASREVIFDNSRQVNSNEEEISSAEEMEREVHYLSNRLKKRSLMAMILKDTLKQRLEEENKPGRHRDIVWGKATRGITGNKSLKPHVIQLSPQLTETLSEIVEEEPIQMPQNYHQQLHQYQQKRKQDELDPIAIVIRPKAGRSVSLL